MDLEKDGNAVPIRKYSNIEYHCNPSKGTYTFSNKVNPFNTVGNYHERRLIAKLQKKNNGEIINIFKHITTPFSESLTSYNAQRTRKIKQELIEDVFSNQTQGHEPMESIYRRSDKSTSQSMFNQPTKQVNSSHATSDLRKMSNSASFKQANYNNYEPNNKHETLTRNICNKSIVSNDNIYADETTDCSQIQNMYNEEFVLKTIQRHARLQKIVRKLVVERQREKQREAWNNYINELKNKHRYYSNEPTRIVPQYVPSEDEYIDDFWDTRCGWEQPELRINLPNSVYEGYRNVQLNKYVHVPRRNSKRYYDHNPVCYPTSSQGRLMMLNKERERINSIPRPLHKYKIFEGDKGLYRRQYENNTTQYDKIFASIPMDVKKFNTQGVVTEKINQENNYMGSFRRIFEKPLPKMPEFKEQILQTENMKEMPLQSIEEKLNILIKSVNSVILEIREQKKLNLPKCPITKSRSISCTLRELSNLVINRTKSQPYGFKKDSEILYTTILQNNPGHLVVTEIGTSASQLKESNEREIEKIIEEEMEKSEKIKKDIEELLHSKRNTQCSVEIEFDIPTREISTVVGNSLSKAQYCAEQEENVNRMMNSEGESNSRQMTIAVNTEPLGLGALFQVSAETIKQLLSYMLNLNYYSYLSGLHMPGRPCLAHYLCNICGEAFTNPSQLSDHIENHYMRRNCCACRHLLNLRKDQIGLFNCQYCGQRFTRSYCCELHQQECAKRLGRKHDVQSNLMLLR